MQVQVSQENLLDVAGPSGGGHHTRSASVRSSHSNNLLQVKSGDRRVAYVGAPLHKDNQGQKVGGLFSCR